MYRSVCLIHGIIFVSLCPVTLEWWTNTSSQPITDELAVTVVLLAQNRSLHFNTEHSGDSIGSKNQIWPAERRRMRGETLKKTKTKNQTSASRPAALTELCGEDGDVVPGVLFSVQLPEDVHWPVACMDVEHSVHVRAPIDSVPAKHAHTHTHTHKGISFLNVDVCCVVKATVTFGEALGCERSHLLVVKLTFGVVGGIPAGRRNSKQLTLSMMDLSALCHYFLSLLFIPRKH